MLKKALYTIILTASILICPFIMSQPINAGSVPIKTPFVDLSTTHWSLQNIIKMNLRAVVNGYPNDTFCPDKPVTQLEAVLMAVRNMDNQDEVNLMDASQKLPFKVPAWAEKDNKQELLFAIDQGLIIPSEDNFSATSYASRAWMAQLMVRMIGKDSDAESMSAKSTSFTDNSTIPSWALGYINAAVKYEVIDGYPDNSFRPTTDINRAETAALLNRSEKYMHLADVIVPARITGIAGNTLSLNANGTALSLKVDNDTWVFSEDGKLDTWSNLNVSDYIKFIEIGDSAIYIELQPYTVIQNTIQGNVLQVIPADNIMVIKDQNGSILTETVNSTVSISDDSGQLYQLDQLASGAQVQLSMDGKNQLVSILIIQSQGNLNNTGFVYSIDKNQKLLILKDAAGKFGSYQYQEEPAIKINDVRFASLDDLQIGDQVRVTVVDKLLTQIELLQVKQQLTFNAKIVLISADKKLLALDNAGTVESYYLVDNASITIPGMSSAVFSDLQVDDNLEVNIIAGKIASLKVINRTGGNDIEGTIVAVDTTEEIVVIKTNDDQMKTYAFSDSAQINVDDDSDATLSDLKKDMRVTIQLLNNEIIYIETGSGVEGKVASINEDRHLISLLLNNGSTQSYVMVKDPTVSIEDDSHTSVSDINKNDYVQVHLENDLVRSIDVETTIEYTIEKIDTDDEELRVEDEDGDSKWLKIKSNVDVNIAGVTSPDIEDFDEGDRVKATYLGSELRKVEVTPSTFGKITDINTSTKRITVLIFNGSQRSYTFNSGSKVIDKQSSTTSLSSLNVGDRVQITENSDETLELTLLTKKTGEFASRDDNKIFLNSSTYSYDVYYLGDNCYVHEGTETLVLRNLSQNDDLELYMLGSTVYEVVRK